MRYVTYKFIYCEGELVGSNIVPKRDNFEYATVNVPEDKTGDVRSFIEGRVAERMGWRFACIRDIAPLN